jgi:hypothetical protein
MKKKIVLYTLLSMFFGYVVILLLNSYFSRPDLNSRLMLFNRIEQLENWREAVKLYISDFGTTPTNLYQVYSYCLKNKKDINLRLIFFPSFSMEESLLKNEAFVNDQDTFLENIDYEIVLSPRDWYVRERNVYPKYLNKSDLLTINSKGKIFDISLVLQRLISQSRLTVSVLYKRT